MIFLFIKYFYLPLNAHCLYRVEGGVLRNAPCHSYTFFEYVNLYNKNRNLANLNRKVTMYVHRLILNFTCFEG